MKKEKKAPKHGIKSTHITHHGDGTHTVTHHHEDGHETGHALPDVEALKEHLGNTLNSEASPTPSPAEGPSAMPPGTNGPVPAQV